MRKTTSTNPVVLNAMTSQSKAKPSKAKRHSVSSNPVVRHAMEWAKPETDAERRKLLRELDKVQDAWTKAIHEMLEHKGDPKYMEDVDKLDARTRELLAILNGGIA